MRLLLTIAMVSLAPLCLAQTAPSGNSGVPDIGVPPLSDMPARGSRSDLFDSFDTSGLGAGLGSGSDLSGLGSSTPPATTPAPTTPSTGVPGGTATPPATSNPSSPQPGRQPSAGLPSTNPLRGSGASPYGNPVRSTAPSLDSSFNTTPPRTMSSGAATTTPPAVASDPRIAYSESLIKAALTKQPNSQLSGTPVTLAEVLEASGSRAAQSEAISAYWDLCSTVSDYYLSLREQAELERYAQTTQMSSALQQVLNRMGNRRDTSLSAARATQMRLASLMRRSETAGLPLPVDLPLVGVYGTRYEQTFGIGGPREAAELNRLLPLRHAELLDAADNVASAEDWFKAVAARQVNDQGEGAVKALELLALNRRAFVQITRDYNKRITRYTELARPGNLRTERLVAMLIKTDTNMASRASQPVVPASGQRSEVSPPSTFREQWESPDRDLHPSYDSEVQPAGALGDANVVLPAIGEQNMVERVNTGETSVLVRPGAVE